MTSATSLGARNFSDAEDEKKRSRFATGTNESGVTSTSQFMNNSDISSQQQQNIKAFSHRTRVHKLNQLMSQIEMIDQKAHLLVKKEKGAANSAAYLADQIESGAGINEIQQVARDGLYMMQRNAREGNSQKRVGEEVKRWSENLAKLKGQY